MEGMLQALESRVNLKEGAALSPKLQALLAHKQRAMKPLVSSQTGACADKLAFRDEENSLIKAHEGPFMTDPRAQERVMLILQVQAGTITAGQAAKQLGISRKTYYQCEQRTLSACWMRRRACPRVGCPRIARPSM